MRLMLKHIFLHRLFLLVADIWRIAHDDIVFRGERKAMGRRALLRNNNKDILLFKDDFGFEGFGILLSNMQCLIGYIPSSNFCLRNLQSQSNSYTPATRSDIDHLTRGQALCEV